MVFAVIFFFFFFKQKTAYEMRVSDWSSDVCSSDLGEDMAAKLFRPDSAIDPVNDGRHTLPDRPLMRESIPYCVVMPKEKIALFTYTWVNKDSVAGAAFGVWGPGVGGEIGSAQV